MALSDTNGQAQLYLGKKSGWHTLVTGQSNRNEGTINVITRTLDSIMEESGNFKADIIKIDVEGAEAQVLKGAVNTLSSNKDIILLIDLHPALGVNPLEISEFLSDLGFSFFKMTSPFDTPLEITPNLRELLARRI